MSKLIDLIKVNNCDYLGNVDLEVIDNAQKDLNVKFSESLIEYISEFGALSYGSNEINGLGTDSYLNIVKSTLEARENMPYFPKSLVVIQNTGINGILILSDDLDNIYEWNGSSYKKIYESLYDFFYKELFV